MCVLCECVQYVSVCFQTHHDLFVFCGSKNGDMAEAVALDGIISVKHLQ